MRTEGTNLSMVAGDTDSVEFKYIIPLVEGDLVYFSVKKRIKDTEYILQKQVRNFTEEGNVIIELEPEDTNLIPPATYVYDIQINFLNGVVKTPIEDSTYTLRPGVTHD